MKTLASREETRKEGGGRRVRNQNPPLLETKVEGQTSRRISEPGGDGYRLRGSNGMMACLPRGTFKLRGDFSVF